MSGFFFLLFFLPISEADFEKCDNKIIKALKSGGCQGRNAGKASLAYLSKLEFPSSEPSKPAASAAGS
jgi:hypothetical protein